jgi:hypothetical protein
MTRAQGWNPCGRVLKRTVASFSRAWAAPHHGAAWIDQEWVAETSATCRTGSWPCRLPGRSSRQPWRNPADPRQTSRLKTSWLEATFLPGWPATNTGTRCGDGAQTAPPWQPASAIGQPGTEASSLCSILCPAPVPAGESASRKGRPQVLVEVLRMRSRLIARPWSAPPDSPDKVQEARRSRLSEAPSQPPP